MPMIGSGEYDFPAPPPMTGEFEWMPLSDRPEETPITGQPERISTIGQPERPRMTENPERIKVSGKHEGMLADEQRGRESTSRRAERRYVKDEAKTHVPGYSRTWESGPVTSSDHTRMTTKHGSPVPFVDQNVQRSLPRYDHGNPPPVAQKPSPRQAFNYLGQSHPTSAIKRQLTTTLIKQPPRQWSSGICSCFSDMKSCCGVLWCGYLFYPCYLSKKLGENVCLPCVMGSTCALISLRTKMRMQERIQGTIYSDCCTVVCCQCCAMCQMSREQDFITHHYAVQ